ncbi:MAG: 4-hydroxybenzoate 3-monooxygenase [Elioraea sp.]|nr:4-hydroxybenzoate 3-monooxygenase [Elioraea sp.]
MRTDVCIIGAGPAGLISAALLDQAGIETVIVEHRARDYVLRRVRAGVLEQSTVETLRRLGAAERLDREGLVHEGFVLAFGETMVRIAFPDLVPGRHVTVYGQTEVVRDLIAHREASGLPLLFETEAVAIEDLEAAPRVVCRRAGETIVLSCSLVFGCDGFHGLARRALPAEAVRTYEIAYPFGWLGLLADVPPAHEELVYAASPSGFALCSMRSPTRSRYYVQVAAGERLEDWPEERFWAELRRRLPAEIAARVTEGPTIEHSIAPLRSFVAEPMRVARLLLLGDAAHVVPPTGAKGLNLAAADAWYAARAAIRFLRQGDETALDAYSATALARVWRTERFSWMMTRLMHSFPDLAPFEAKMQEAERAYVAASRAARTVIAENYVGLPLD